jgi:hypothetical protein
MTRVLLDHNVPRGLSLYLSGHELRTAEAQGWDRLTNGELLDAAEMAGFAVLVTADQGIRHQQRLAGRNIAVVVLPTNRWRIVRENGERIARAVDRARAGDCIEVEFR